MTFGGIFWYVFTYVQVILWVPLLSFICVNDRKANRCRYYVMLLAAVYIINSDISNIAVLTINGDSYPATVYSIITPTLLYVLIGYETYVHRETIQRYSGWLKWLGLLSFVCFNLLKYTLAVRDMRIDSKDSYFLDIYTVNGYFASYGLFITILCTKLSEDTKTTQIIRHFGSKTLSIYLIHGCVFRKMNAVGIRSAVYSSHANHPDNLIIEILCTLLYTIIVFIVCYLIVCAYQFIKRQFKRTLHRHFE